MVTEQIKFLNPAHIQSDLAERADIADPMSGIARKLFIQSAIAYPTSITGQAAMIAGVCQDRSLDPDVLREALAQDKNSISALTNAANKVHRLSNNKGVPEKVDEDRIQGIIKQIFLRAKNYARLPRKELKKIEKTYNRIFRQDIALRQKEYLLERFAGEKLRKHGLLFSYED